MVEETQLLVTSPGDPELSQIHWFPLGSGNVTRNQGADKTAGTSALCLRFPQHLGVPVTLDAVTPLPQFNILLGKKASVTPCGRGLITAHSFFEERGR